jgi:hypothetical protein
VSNGRRVRYDSDEKPVPKSSSASRRRLRAGSQDHGGPLGVAHDVAFGDFQLQGAARQAVLAQGLGDVGHQARAVDLAGRQVDADGQGAHRRVRVAPGGQLLGGGVHHVRAQLAHQPHLFDQRQELVGRQHAAARVDPAGQGLEARQRARRQAHDGLEVGLDLAAGDGAAQVGFQSQARQAVGFHRAAIGGGAATAGGGGGLDGQLGAAQQLGGVRRVQAAFGRTAPIDRVGWMSKPATRSGCSSARRSSSAGS